MGGQLDGIFLAGSLPHEFIILIVTLFICLWLINFSLSLSLSLVCTSLLRCCAYNRFLCLAKGGWWEGRGEQLTITPVPRTLNGPLLQLKLDVCLLSASCNSYKGLQMSKCY